MNRVWILTSSAESFEALKISIASQAYSVAAMYDLSFTLAIISMQFMGPCVNSLPSCRLLIATLSLLNII